MLPLQLLTGKELFRGSDISPEGQNTPQEYPSASLIKPRTLDTLEMLKK